MVTMSSSHFLRKRAALVAASYADRDNNKDHHGRGDNERGGERHGETALSNDKFCELVLTTSTGKGAQ